jgi:hypothetical protein
MHSENKHGQSRKFLWLIVRSVMLTCLGAFLLLFSEAQDIETLKQHKPVKMQGGIQATSMFYKAKGIPDRYLPFNYVITGSPIFTFYGIQMPVSFTVGRQQSNFTQPFNQFGLSPKYKWATLHLGYRSLNFSPLTLGGHIMLGAGFELNPGRLRMAFMYGRFNKATLQDTATQFFLSAMPYKRTGFSGRIGFGTEDNFVDLIFLQAKDDSASLAPAARKHADSLGIRAASNTVTGINTRWTLLKNKLTLEAEGALSFYTFDQGAPAVTDSSLENFIKWGSSVGSMNSSSELYNAMQVAMKYKTRLWSLKLQYRYVAPGYKSMGAYFLNNDLENLTIAPSFNLSMGRYRFSGSLGLQRDDLHKQKRAKAKRVIGSANFSGQFTERLGMEISFSNYSINQTVKTIRFADSLKLVQSSLSASLMPRYQWSGEHVSHLITGYGIINRVKELNPQRDGILNGDITTTNLGLQYQWMQMQTQLTLMAGMNYTILESIPINERNWGPTCSATKTFVKQRINLSVSGAYLINERNGDGGQIINAQFQGRYQLPKHHSFRISANYISNNPNLETADYPRFTEWRGEAGYAFTF